MGSAFECQVAKVVANESVLLPGWRKGRSLVSDRFGFYCPFGTQETNGRRRTSGYDVPKQCFLMYALNYSFRETNYQGMLVPRSYRWRIIQRGIPPVTMNVNACLSAMDTRNAPFECEVGERDEKTFFITNRFFPSQLDWSGASTTHTRYGLNNKDFFSFSPITLNEAYSRNINFSCKLAAEFIRLSILGMSHTRQTGSYVIAVVLLFFC